MKIHTYNLRGTLWHRTALQARRISVRFPMVSLEFFIDIILEIEWLKSDEIAMNTGRLMHFKT